MTTSGEAADTVVALVVAGLVFVIYNANGREIASYDSQPTKFAARELLLRGNTSLNYVVGRTPELLDRSGFRLARDGRYRSAYSPVPAILAAAVAWPFWKSGIIDVRAPRGPGLIAKIGSSLLVALAVGLAYLVARLRLSRRQSLFIAAAYGLGTGLWSTASQTLWQHETAILGLTSAVYGLANAGRRAPIVVGLGLGLTVVSRLQLLPLVVVIVAAMPWLFSRRDAAITGAIVLAFLVAIATVNYRWFGTVLGAAPMLEALHRSVHGTSRSFSLQWEGAAGLLISPNRGLLIFSPVVALAAAGIPAARKDPWRRVIFACSAAAVAQFVLYASYTVWWGGHTYGPRYMLDILPLLLPLGVAAAPAVKNRVTRLAAYGALAWSVHVAAIGAFCYPHERWNSDPVNVDQNHYRLWHWSDNQIARAWNAGRSPQNYTLLTREAFRVPQP